VEVVMDATSVSSMAEEATDERCDVIEAVVYRSL